MTFPSFLGRDLPAPEDFCLESCQGKTRNLMLPLGEFPESWGYPIAGLFWGNSHEIGWWRMMTDDVPLPDSWQTSKSPTKTVMIAIRSPSLGCDGPKIPAVDFGHGAGKSVAAGSARSRSGTEDRWGERGCPRLPYELFLESIFLNWQIWIYLNVLNVMINHWIAMDSLFKSTSVGLMCLRSSTPRKIELWTSWNMEPRTWGSGSSDIAINWGSKLKFRWCILHRIYYEVCHVSL